MQVTVVKPERKLIAVRDLRLSGVFLRYVTNPRQSVYWTADGCDLTEYTLEQLLAESKDRTPIYEGDTIKIEF